MGKMPMLLKATGGTQPSPKASAGRQPVLRRPMLNSYGGQAEHVRLLTNHFPFAVQPIHYVPLKPSLN
jgi:hypothetical protein